jgi:hypothetical protein
MDDDVDALRDADEIPLIYDFQVNVSILQKLADL